MKCCFLLVLEDMCVAIEDLIGAVCKDSPWEKKYVHEYETFIFDHNKTF